MIARRTFLLTLAAALLMCIAPASRALAEDVMVKLEGVTQQSGYTVINGILLSNGSHVRVPLPNEPLKPKETGAPQPKKELLAALKNAKPGDVLKLGIEGTKSSPLLTSIDPYDTKPGEDTPNGYVFSKTYDKQVGKVATTLVILTKFGVEDQFSILMKKGEKGEQEQDPDVVAAIGKLQSGNTVWVQTQPGGKILTIIEPYVDPQIGKLGKLGETEIDGHKVPSAEVETEGGKTVTILVPVKEVGKTFMPDKMVVAQLHKVRTGSQVAFRVHEDGDKLWLREIGPAPAVPKAPPEKKDTAKKPAK